MKIWQQLIVRAPSSLSQRLGVRVYKAGLQGCRVDVFLAGHLHVSHIGHTATRDQVGGRSSLVVQAGTAASTRGRGEANSFNVIRLAGPNILIERFVWQPAHAVFVGTVTDQFRRSGDGWSRL